MATPKCRNQITMDIAKAEDGRTILYTLNGKTKKVGNAHVNSLKIKGSRQNSNFATIIPQNSQKSSGSAKFTPSKFDGH